MIQCSQKIPFSNRAIWHTNRIAVCFRGLLSQWICLCLSLIHILGQCFVVLPGQVMTEIADESDPWEHTWVTIGGIRTGMMFQSVGISPKSPLLPWDSNPEFLKALRYAIDVYDRGSVESEFRRIGHAFLIFDMLAQYMRCLLYTSRCV